MKVSISALLAALILVLVLATVTAQQDTDPPHLVSLSLTPGQVDVSHGDREIVATAHLTDDISGLDDAKASQVRFMSPNGQQHIDFLFLPEYNLVSGDDLDGVYVDTRVLPQYAEDGIWELAYLIVSDRAGNRQYLFPSQLGSAQLPLSFSVISSPTDNTPPSLVSFDYTPKVIDTSIDVVVTFTARFTDDLSGVSEDIRTTQARFRSPSGDEFVVAMFEPDRTLVSGDSLDGTYVDPVTIPAGSEPGIWDLEYFLAYDNAGNRRYFFSPDDQPTGSLRMPYLVMIDRPPLPIWLPIIGR